MFARLSATTRGSISVVLSLGIRTTLALGLMVLSARILGPSQFGFYSTILAWAAIFQAIAGFGTQTPLAQALVQYPNQMSYVIQQAWKIQRLSIPISILLFLSVMVLELRHSEINWLYSLFMVPMIAFPYFENINQKLIAQQRSDQMAKIGIEAFLISASLSLLALYFQCLWAFIACAGLEFLCLGGLLIWNSRKYPYQDYGTKPQSITMFNATFPLLIAGAIQILHQRLGILLLENLDSSAEAGRFAAAFRLTGLIATVMSVLVAPLFAQLSTDWYHRKHLFDERLSNQANTLAALAWLAFSAFVLFGGWICTHILGHGYTSCTDLILPLAIANLLFCLRPIYDRIINLWSKPWYETFSYLVLTASLLGLQALFIPSYGAIGAAWAYVGSVVCGQFLWLVKSAEDRRFLKVQLRALAWPILWPLGKSKHPWLTFRNSDD